MKKLIHLVFLAMLVNSSNAKENLDSLQLITNSEFNKRISVVEGSIKTLNRTIEKDKTKISALKDSLVSLKSQLSGGLTVIDSHVSDLNTDLSKANEELMGVKEVGEQSQRDLHEYLSYVFGAICIILLLIILVYWLFHRKHTTGQSDLAEAKSHLQNQISTANVEFAEKLLEVITALPKPDEVGGKGTASTDNQGLILDFAQQIASMENNIWHLPENDRVRRKIEIATKKMRDNFRSLGYEMPNLLGTEISDNQVIEIRNRKQDSSIESGKSIVCLVVVPQVLFQGKPLKRATVDVIENIED